jgi:hypothetical protein
MYNTLSDSIVWNLEGAATKPPALAKLSGTLKNYTNIVGVANLLELIRDSDQNIPLFFTTTSGEIQFDFGIAYEPKLIAIVNHNCYASGDHIEIRRGVAGGTLVFDIATPNRSVDLFYPLRFNDVWYNSGATTDRYWSVKLIKSSGAPYVGEIFVASDFHSFVEWEPTPDWPISWDFQRQTVRHEIEAGTDVIYDDIPPNLTAALNWGLKGFSNDSPLLQNITKTSAAAQRFSPYKQLMTLPFAEDEAPRACLFGKFAPSASYRHDAADLAGPQHSFTGEYPRRFFRDEIFD